MKAPDFSLQDQFDNTQSLKDYAGKWVVLYFYPKDGTPGCTTEACSFRDEFKEIEKAGAIVLGVSKDSVKSHAKFAEKYNLNFPLLADTDLKVMKAYGAYGPKKFMGREYEGTIRKTFLIDPKGEVVKEYPKVTPKDHAVQIIKDLSELQNK